MSNSCFERIVLVHTGERPENDLLEYTALLAATAENGQALVAAYPSNGVLRSLSPAARQLFEARGLQSPRIRMLSEPDVDAALETALEHNADLLVMRHPKVFETRRTLARRVLTEAPCSVCFVPEGAEPKLTRVIAGIELDSTGHTLLARAARLCHEARAEELIALYSYFQDSSNDDESGRERFRTERTLDLFRFMARAELSGVSCTPVAEEAPAAHRALARVACERQADLVVVGHRPGTASPVTRELLWDCPSPLVQVRLGDRQTGWKGAMRRVFSNPEPKFN